MLNDLFSMIWGRIRYNLKLVFWALVLVGVVILFFSFLKIFSDDLGAYNPITDDGLVSYVQSQIYNEYGDEVDVKITSKEKNLVCVDYISGLGCGTSKTAEDVYNYKFEIINKNFDKLTSVGWYYDSYKIYNSKTQSVHESYYQNNYDAVKKYYLFRTELNSIVQSSSLKTYLSDYVYYRTESDSVNSEFVLFAYSMDFNIIESLLSNIYSLNSKYKTNDGYYFNCYIYVFNDENAFNSMNFELFQNSSFDLDKLVEQSLNKSVLKLDDNIIFNKDYYNGKIFYKRNSETNETIDTDCYDYVIFSRRFSTSLNYSSSNYEIYGIK